MARIESPCIGICSTTLGDDICRGCKRHSDEILRWGGADAQFREEVMQRIEAHTLKIVGLYFTLIDKDQLEQQLNQHRIRYTKRFSPLCWVVDLLRAGAGRIRNLDAYGLQLTAVALQEADTSRTASHTDAGPDMSQLLEQLYRKINQTLIDETQAAL